MQRFRSKFYVGVKKCCRQITSQWPENFKPRNVDLKEKLVYGGDLPIATSRKSVGSILFERLMDKERQDRVFQICAETENQMTTNVYVKKAVAVAEALQEKGIRKGDFIVLFGNNSLNMNTALTGIFFLGAVPVPLTHKTTIDELKILIENIQPKYFACDEQYLIFFKKALEEISNYDSSKLFLISQKKDETESNIESFAELIKGRGNVESFKPTEVEKPEEELALVMKILREGTIGKGIKITHHNINSVIARYDAKNKEKLKKMVILMVHKVMWLSGLYSLILSCCFGSTLIVMNEFKEEFFMQFIQDYKVTHSFIHSSKLWQLFKHKFEKNYDVSSCKYITAVDGFLPQFLIEGMKEKTGLNLKIAFEKSELTGLVLEQFGTKKQGSTGKLVPQVYGKVISDKSFNKLGPYEKGEICFKSPTSVKGFVNDEESFGILFDEEGYFLSGHYGYYDEEGNFFLIDKTHHVINYKGNKISPMELEGIIHTLEAVREVAVSGIPHITDGHVPIALIVLQKGQKIGADDIIKFVDGQVPDYKRLRGGAIFIPKIPRSREYGAINRNLLKKILSNYQMQNITSESDKLKLSETQEVKNSSEN